MQEETVIQSSLIGMSVHVSIFRPQTRAVYGVIQVVHGLTEHRGMYREMGEFFSDAGYLFLAHNIIGHGEDLIDRVPAYLPKKYLSWTVRDIEKVYQDCLDKEEKLLPRIVVGFSFGSYLARCLIQETDAWASGIVLAGGGQPGPFIRKAGSYLAGKLVDKYGGMNSGKKIMEVLLQNDRFFYETYPYCWRYADREQAEKYIKDPLAVKEVTSATMETATHAVQSANAPGGCRKPGMSILLLCGTRDAMTPRLGELASQFNEYGYQCIDRGSIFGGRHNVLTDACCRGTWKEILRWIEYRKS